MSHYRPYPKYKDSGVEWLGEVPEGWGVDRLKRSITSCRNGIWGGDAQGNEDDIPCVRVADFDRPRLRVELMEPTIRNVTVREREGRMLKSGNLLLEKSGGGENQPVGYVVLYDDEREAVCSNFIAKVQIAKAMVPSFWRYVHHAAYSVRLNTRSIKQTSGIQNLDDHQYFDERAVFPSYAEQQTIAAFLDRETTRIDTLIAKKTRFIELLKEKRQAVITQAVTKGLNDTVPMKDSGVKWLGMVPAHWNVGRLSDYCHSISTGPFGTALKSADYIDGGVPVLNPSHLEDGFCVPDPGVSVSDETSRRLVFWHLKCGDVITARRGELGRAALITMKEEGWLCGTGSLRLRPTGKIKAEFIIQILQSKYARSWLEIESVGSTMPNLSEGLIGRLPMVIPPSIDEQTKLVEKLEQIIHRLDLLHKKTERSIELLKEHRAALITAAVTGKIDVREAA